MLAFFEETLVHPATRVKRRKADTELIPLSKLYPEGNEFVEAPKGSLASAVDLREQLLKGEKDKHEEAWVQYQATATETDKPLGVSLGKVPPYPIVEVKSK